MNKPLPPTVFLICLVAISLFYGFLPGPQIISQPYNLIGIILIIAGLAIAMVASRQFIRIKTNIDTFSKPGTLVTTGLFPLSRNPMYLGFVSVLCGVSFICGALNTFLPTIAFILICQFWYIPFEEQNCVAVFGKAYGEYCARTDRWFGFSKRSS